MKLSEVLSQKIIRMSEASYLGVILTVTVDEKARYIKQFVTADEEEEDGYIPVKKVFFGRDAAFTVNSGLVYEKVGCTLPIRREVYDTDGMKLGVLTDLEFEGNKIVKIYLTTGVLESPVVKVGEKMIVAQGERMIRSKKAKKEKPDFNAFNVPEKAVEEEVAASVVAKEKAEVSDVKERVSTAVEGVSTEEKPVLKTDKDIPEKLVYGYEFLLGRVVTKSVNKGSKAIANKGDIIDADTVERAGKEGKLVELTVNSI